MKKAIQLFICLLCATSCFAQTSECFVPLEVSIPFNKRKNLVEKVHKETAAELNKSFFLRADDYSYWYRVDASENAEIDITLSACNLGDLHDILIFKYEGDNFCDDIVFGDFPEENLLDKVDFHNDGGKNIEIEKFFFEKGATYYIAVMAFNVFDCGHILRLQHGKNVLKLNAIHRSCFKFQKMPVEVKKQDLKEDNGQIEVQGNLISKGNSKNISGTIIFQEDKTKAIFEAKVSENRGYRVQLNAGKKYNIQGSAIYHDDLDTMSLFTKDTVFNLQLNKLGKGSALVFRDIYFHGNVHKMKDESLEGLQQLLKFMNDNPEYKIEIQGHTAGDTPVRTPDPRYKGRGDDWIFSGSAKKLSKMRANEVKKYLSNNGIASSRMKVVGYGASKKIYENPTTDREHRLNMRVEILILSD